MTALEMRFVNSAHHSRQVASALVSRLQRLPTLVGGGAVHGHLEAIMTRFRPPRIAMLLVGAAALAEWWLGPFIISKPHPGAGWAVGVMGFLLMVEGWRLFKRDRVAICPTAPTERLVTHGLYRVTRNPMYLGLVLMLAGAAVGVGTAPFYVATIVYFLIVDRVFCRYEEAKLVARFGSEYAAYTRQVRRWL
ncbi:MAG: isoprenylcysteine carboxylmethyltransferase family protein [Vicinamibacterales bacterium]